MDIARRVRTGTYGVNQYTMDFIAPFGGYKASGIGREFGTEGLEHYLELKSIVPKDGDGIEHGRLNRGPDQQHLRRRPCGPRPPPASKAAAAGRQQRSSRWHRRKR